MSTTTDQLLSETPAPLRRVITHDDVNRAMAEQYSQPQTPRIDLEPTIDFGDELRWLAWELYATKRGWGDAAMKTLTARSLDESPSPALTWTEHALVEFELSMSGRSAVRNAVLRNGEGYMRQIATLPAVIAPPVAPRPAPRPRRQQVWLEGLAMAVITIAWIWALVWVVNVVAGRG